MYFGNAYIHIFTRDNIYTVTGPNFGEWEFQVLIYVRYIYGLNIFMAMWHEALLYKSNIIVLLPSKVDPDLWMQDSEDHYEYVTVYSGDLLVFNKDPTSILIGLNTFFPLKGVGEPDFYLVGYV